MVDATKPYIVTAAHFDDDGRLLNYVFVGIPPQNADRTVDGMRLYTRAQLIDALKKGKEFLTAYKVRNQWQFNERVRLVVVDGQDYLRVDAQRTPVDDLGSLAKIRASR